MTAAECVKLLDAILRSPAPACYTKGAQIAFSDAGLEQDADVAAVIAELYGLGEIEFLMHMRAEWSGERKL